MTSLDYAVLVHDKISNLKMDIFRKFCNTPKIRFLKRKGLMIAYDYLNDLWGKELLHISHLMSLEREEYNKFKGNSN